MNTSKPGKRQFNPDPQTSPPSWAKVLDGTESAPSRAMLYPVGFKAEAGAKVAGGKAIVFYSCTISDGIFLAKVESREPSSLVCINEFKVW